MSRQFISYSALLLIVFCFGCSSKVVSPTIGRQSPEQNTLPPSKTVGLDQHSLSSEESLDVEQAFYSVLNTSPDILAQAAKNNEAILGVEADVVNGHFFIDRLTLEEIVEDEIDNFPCVFSAHYFQAQGKRKFPQIAVFDKQSRKLICKYDPVKGLKWVSRETPPNFRRTEAGEIMGANYWHPDAYKDKRNHLPRNQDILSAKNKPKASEGELAVRNEPQTNQKNLISDSRITDLAFKAKAAELQEMTAGFRSKISGLDSQVANLKQENLMLKKALELAHAEVLDLRVRVSSGIDASGSQEEANSRDSMPESHARSQEKAEATSDSLHYSRPSKGANNLLRIEQLRWDNVPEFSPTAYRSDISQRLSIFSHKFRLSKENKTIALCVRFEIQKDGTPVNFSFPQGIGIEIQKRCVSFIQSSGPFRPLLAPNLQELWVELELEQKPSQSISILDLHLEGLGNRL